MQNFVDDATAQGLNGPLLLRCEIAQSAANAIEFGLPYGFKLVLQRDDCWRETQAVQPRLKAFHFRVNELLSPLGFLLAPGYVGRDRLLQVVDVIHKDAVEPVHLGIDVAWNGNINEEHRAVTAAAEKEFAVFAAKDGDRRSGRGDYDVGLLALTI